MQSTPIKLIIFDFYGVIVKGSYKDTCKWLSKKFKKPYNHIYKILYHKYFNQAAEGKINERQFFLRSLHELGFKIDWREVQAKHIDGLILNPPMFAFARRLQKQGFKILFLSKNTPAQLKIILKKYNIRHHIKNVINTYDLGLPKADRRTIRYILRRFKVAPQEVLMTDDQDFNLKEPARLGVRTVIYKNNKQVKHDLLAIINAP